MARRVFNEAAKLKRFRNLILAIPLTLIFPFQAFISEWLAEGMNKLRFVEFIATQHSFIWLGVMIVVGTMLNEVGKKHKPPATKALLSVICLTYILSGVLLYSYMQGTNSLLTVDYLQRVAELIAYFYVTGLGISALAIWAGTS